MTTVVLVFVASLATLLAVIVLGSSRSESVKRRVGIFFRRAPRSSPAPAGHYYRPYWSR